MGIGPLNYGGAGSKKGVHGCGTPMKKISSNAQKQALINGAKDNPAFAAIIAKQKIT